MKQKIYLLKCDINDSTFYKIGRTKNTVSERIDSLKTGNPGKIECIFEHETDNALLLEKSLHNYFSHLRLEGEWFSEKMSITKFKEYCEKLDYHLTKLNNGYDIL